MRTRWALLGVVLAIGIGVGAWYVTNSTATTSTCAGGGTITDTRGASPGEAMAAFVRSVGGDPEDWEAGGHASDHSYEPTTTGALPAGVKELVVREVEAGTWRATGVCLADDAASSPAP